MFAAYFKGLNEDFFNIISKPNSPPHELHLKSGEECYIMRNISPNGGLLNNTMVKVIEITRRLIKVLILANNQVHYIPRINFTMSLPRKNFSITRIQFPLRSGYSRTVNRSQGTTLDKLGLDMREEPFSHGQLFVALSRVRYEAVKT